MSRLLVPVVLLAASCGAEGYIADPEPTFDATWTVESLILDGVQLDLRTDVIIVDINTSTAEVEVATGCRSLFGSFTFLDDGRSGFSLPGATKPACDRDEEPWLIELDESIAAALGAVATWSAIGDQLILDGPDSEVVLVRVG